MKRRQGVLLGAFAAGLMVSFQNCGKGFQTKVTDSLSAQCQAKIKESAPSFKLSAEELNCSDFNQYSCERRIFSPDVSDISHSLKECLPGDQICVDVDVREFNTSSARKLAGVSPESLQPGGEFNREEVHCYHRMVYRGVSLFEGSGETIEESLAHSMAACEQAQGGTK